MVHSIPNGRRHDRMWIIRASRVCVLAAVVGACAVEAIAGERARTPAEIELRRGDVLRRLEAIEREGAALGARQTELLDRLAGATPAEAVALAEDAERLRAATLALVEEAAALRTEYADLAAIRTRSISGPLLQGDTQGLGVLDVATSGDQVTAARAFNPAIAIIPDINYFTDNRRGRGFVLSRQADGFAVPGDEDPATTDPERGFNLRELEVAFMGTIDPYFDVWSTVVIQGDRIAVEEAYVQTRRFVPGMQLRVGRFLSGMGYLNRQHPHQWDFLRCTIREVSPCRASNPNRAYTRKRRQPRQLHTGVGDASAKERLVGKRLIEGRAPAPDGVLPTLARRRLFKCSADRRVGRAQPRPTTRRARTTAYCWTGSKATRGQPAQTSSGATSPGVPTAAGTSPSRGNICIGASG